MKSSPLTHNLNNSVTASINLVEDHAGRRVVKILNGRNSAETPREWMASDEPAHWNYWQREAHAYKSQLNDLIEGTGVRMPRLLKCEQADAQTISLELECLEGRTGNELTIDDYETIATAWGKAQRRLSEVDLRTSWPWMSTDFISAYGASKPIEYAWLRDDALWRAPLIADNWPDELREGLIFLAGHREDLYNLLASTPQVACHLDFWPNNVFVTSDQTVVLVDWAFFGTGAPLEDVGNFIPDAVFDGFQPAARFSELADRMQRAYVAGYGADADIDFERLLYATAVKYVWLGPLLLARASKALQTEYGGAHLDDASDQYRERGEVLLHLAQWAERAVSGA